MHNDDQTSLRLYLVSIVLMLPSFYDYAVIVTLSAWISVKFQVMLDHNLTNFGSDLIVLTKFLSRIFIYPSSESRFFNVSVDYYSYKRSNGRLLS